MIRNITIVSVLSILFTPSVASGFKCEDIKEPPVREACVAERANSVDVPKVLDPSKVVVNGKPMTQREFLKKFCVGKTFDETCVTVRRQMSMEATRSKTGVPRF